MLMTNPKQHQNILAMSRHVRAAHKDGTVLVENFLGSAGHLRVAKVHCSFCVLVEQGPKRIGLEALSKVSAGVQPFGDLAKFAKAHL